MLDWIKKIAGYAPDIAAAVATGGTSLAVTGLRILGKELLGNESATESEIERAVMSASPEQMVKLQISNNEFKAEMKRLENESKRDDHNAAHQEHQTTQATIQNGDNNGKWYVSATRPAHATISLAAAIYYALTNDSPNFEILGALLMLPFTYSGMRQMGKWKTADSLTKLATGSKNK